MYENAHFVHLIHTTKKITEKIFGIQCFSVCVSGTPGYKDVSGSKRMGLVGKYEEY